MLQRSALVVCVVSSLVSYAAAFEPVPTEPNGSPSGLEMRVLRYNGSTNGAITIEVKNPTSAAVAFGPQGLFFVPDVDPDHAPQRLGAVGAFLRKGQPQRLQTLTIAAGATEQLTLDVYCIDSHRPSPSEATPFRVSKDRMPRELSQTIDANTRAAGQPYGGVSAPRAKSAVQGEVWKTRDAKWIELDGEGRQEAPKKGR